MHHARRLLACLLAIFAHAALSATVIDTSKSPNWNGAQGVGTFGYPNTATYGQVITVPSSDTWLTNFTLFLSLPPTSIFRGAVYAWDAQHNRATGASLYESAPRQTINNGMTPETFVPDAPLKLSVGKQYVLLISVSKDNGSGTGIVGHTGADVYSGGAFYWLNNSNDASQWTSTSWTEYAFPVGGDLAMLVTFDGGGPNPVPALDGPIVLVTVLLVSLFGVRLYRRRFSR
jgi:hypothetical protein